MTAMRSSTSSGPWWTWAKAPCRSTQAVTGRPTAANELGITYLLGRDPDGRFTVALAAVGLPVTAFVDRQGALAHVHHGPLEVDDLMAVIREHLS